MVSNTGALARFAGPTKMKIFGRRADSEECVVTVVDLRAGEDVHTAPLRHLRDDAVGEGYMIFAGYSGDVHPVLLAEDMRAPRPQALEKAAAARRGLARITNTDAAAVAERSGKVVYTMFGLMADQDEIVTSVFAVDAGVGGESLEILWLAETMDREASGRGYAPIMLEPGASFVPLWTFHTLRRAVELLGLATVSATAEGETVDA
jgi:hypothetical protein